MGLSKVHRPDRFADMVDDDLSVKTLRSLVRRPNRAPRSIVLSGSYGCGKTTAAKIFAKAINCKSSKDDACGECQDCIDSSKSPVFSEFDSSIVGNVESMGRIRDLFAFNVEGLERVIVFDECQRINPEAQSKLLTPLEGLSGVFVLFATTDSDSLLDTILSRSFEIPFTTKSNESIQSLVEDVAYKESITLTEEDVKTIVWRSGGHVRDALNLLESLGVLGSDDFQSVNGPLERDFVKMMMGVKSGDRQAVKDLVGSILLRPLTHVRSDFSNFMKKLADRVYVESDPSKVFRSLVSYYLTHNRYLRTSDDWYLFFMSVADRFDGTKTSDRRLS